MRLLKIQLVLASAILLASAASAQETTADCTPAQAPARVTISPPKEPEKPACSKKNNCSTAAVNEFNAQILVFNRRMVETNEAAADYVDALNDYARAAGRYSNCEISRLNAAMQPN